MSGQTKELTTWDLDLVWNAFTQMAECEPLVREVPEPALENGAALSNVFIVREGVGGVKGLGPVRQGLIDARR